jgi:hypothetical protein
LRKARSPSTRAGAKLLDFGLAKTRPALSGAALSVSAPVTADLPAPAYDHPLTAQGTILGTFQYMAPEQLEGQEAGPRTDIFAFGAVLYEMATGRRAFEGKTKTSLIAAIVGGEPTPISQIRPLTPPALEHVVQKCLAKDPDDRWQSLHDVAEELRWISQAGSQAGVAAPLTIRRRTREKLAWATAAAAVAGLAAAGALLTLGDVSPAAYSFTIPRADHGYVLADAAVVSPDGRFFALRARAAEDKPFQIFVRSAASFDVRALGGTENAGIRYAWSLDSRSIVFLADDKVRVVDVSGGSERTVAEGREQYGFAMNRDGVILVGSGVGGLRRVSASGGPIETITTPSKSRHEVWHGFPTFLPDGKRFLFISFVRDPGRRDQPHYLHAGSLESSEVTLVGEIPSRVEYVDPGRLLFVRDGTLMAQGFDANSLRLTGDPQAIANSVFYFKPTGVAEFSTSTSGILTYRAPSGGQSLVWVDRTGSRVGSIGAPASFGPFRFAPDGAGIAASVTDPKTGTPDLWMYGTRRETATRLTFASGFELGPVFTPDGKRLLYSNDVLGVPDIFVKEIGSPADDRPLVVATGEQYADDVSPDGRFLVYSSVDYTTSRTPDLYVVALDGDARPTPFVRTPFVETGARFSPDGRLIAYEGSESGQPQVYVRAFPGPAPARQVSTRGGRMPRWSPDGKRLYFRQSNRIHVVDMTAPDAEPQVLFEFGQRFESFEVAPDGQRFLLNVFDELADQTPTRVVVNWPELLKAR